MAYKHLIFTIEEGLAKICLNRPAEGNTFNLELADELEDVARNCLVAGKVSVVVLTGCGKLFSGGGDLSYMQENRELLDVAIKKLADRLHSAFSSLARMDAPLVVGINGTAAGIGLSLALLGDLVIAADSASFVASYTRVGLCPDGGLTYTLPRLVGSKRAKEFILTNRVLSAEEALNWGMVDRVVAQKELDSEIMALARRLQEGSLASQAAVKRLLAESYGASLESQMQAEGIALAACAMSENGKEGIAAFLAGRKPKFS